MKRIQINKEVICRKEEEEWVLFNPQTSALHIISEFGYALYIKCKEPIDLQLLLDEVSTEYELVDEKKKFVLEFYNALLKRNLISEV